MISVRPTLADDYGTLADGGVQAPVLLRHAHQSEHAAPSCRRGRARSRNLYGP